MSKVKSKYIIKLGEKKQILILILPLKIDD